MTVKSKGIIPGGLTRQVDPIFIRGCKSPRLSVASLEEASYHEFYDCGAGGGGGMNSISKYVGLEEATLT